MGHRTQPDANPSLHETGSDEMLKVGYVPGHAANPDKQAEQETFKTQELELV